MPDFGRPRVDLEALRAFVAVAQSQSFSAAASSLHKTKSAISHRIKKLEDSIGTPLFARTTRSVGLTASGEILLDKANQIFEWLQTLPDELKLISDGVEPRFTLVINSLLYDAQAAALLLAHLHQCFPRTDFKVSSAVYMGVWDQMLYGGGHLAIGTPGFHTISNEFDTKQLGVVKWVFVVTPDHPLASAPQPLEKNTLRKYPAINVEDTAMRITKRTAWRLPGQQELLVPDFSSKIACHLNGLGIGFLPELFVRDCLSKGQLVVRETTSARAPSPLSLAWRTSHAGKIAAYICSLIEARDPLVEPFIRPIDPCKDI